MPRAKKHWRYVLFIVAGFFLCRPIFAASDPFRQTFSARPVALGGAFSGVMGDAGGIFYNPAGLTTLAYPNFTSLYSQPLEDKSLAMLGGAWPGQWGGTLGFGYRNQIVSNIQPAPGYNVSYIIQDASFIYARKINEQFSLGGGIRWLAKSLSTPVPSFEGMDGVGGGLDLGAFYNINSWCSTGLTARNIFGRVNYRDGYQEELDLDLSAGLSLKLFGRSGWQERLDQELFLNLDLTRNDAEPLLQGHLGLEWWPLSSFALRCGLDQEPKSASDNYNLLTAGFGLNYKGIIFDYAYKVRDDISQNTAHYFSFGYAGSEPVQSSAEVPSLQQVKEVADFTDVPAGYWAKEPIEALTALGIFDYYPDGTFRPEQPVYRAETVKMLVEAKNWPLVTNKKQVFPDVPLDFWAAPYIQTARENKLTLGFPDGTFRPRKATTRAEGVVFLSRFSELSLSGVRVLPFPDLAKDHWAVQEILAAKEEGLLNYLSGQNFEAKKELTRGELAELLYRTKLIEEKMEAAGLR